MQNTILTLTDPTTGQPQRGKRMTEREAMDQVDGWTLVSSRSVQHKNHTETVTLRFTSPDYRQNAVVKSTFTV